MNKTRTSIRDIVASISPLDEREQADIAEVLVWIDSGAQLYRVQSPDVPSKHLVAYLAVIDRARESVLLLHHRKAGIWLPAGGHVEVDEDPRDTAVRELAEELGTRAAMVATVADLPLFVTATQTRGYGNHTDVSLWYVVSGDERMWIEADPGEFLAYKWMPFQEVLDMDNDELDPQMHRFISKLQRRV